MLLLFIILILVGFGVAFYILKYANGIKAETEALAVQIAKDEGVQNDFMFAWKCFAVVLDRKQKNALLCEKSGTWEFMKRNGCNYIIDIGNDGTALQITTKDFDDQATYLFKGTKEEITDLERRLYAVLD